VWGGNFRFGSTSDRGRDGDYVITGSDDGTARVWDTKWLVNVRPHDLVRRCAEKLLGDTKLFTSQDALDPILSGLAGTNPCERRGAALRPAGGL
jgi:hypothetical protein